MIDAHIIDPRGLYLRTEQVDPMGPQPAGAIYAALPAAKAGQTRMWRGQWDQLPNAEVPQLPPPAPEPVPQSITRAQGKAALIQSGLWAGVLQYVAAIADETERALAEVALHDTLEWQRSSPFLNAAATGLGLDANALDALFVMAQGIEL